MLKNAVESAYYYPDSRKRIHNFSTNYEKGINLSASRIRSLDYGRFSSPGLYFDVLICN